jgi:hypothetical protein
MLDDLNVGQLVAGTDLLKRLVSRNQLGRPKVTVIEASADPLATNQIPPSAPIVSDSSMVCKPNPVAGSVLERTGAIALLMSLSSAAIRFGSTLGLPS